MLPLTLVMLLGCNETELRQIEKRMEVSPTLSDVGKAWIGEEVPQALRFDATQGGDIQILSIEVLNTAGEAFFYDGDADILVDRAEGATADIFFRPEEVGYHVASVEIVSEAVNSPHTVQLRGQGLEPDLTVTPPVIDFGFVSASSYASDEVTIRNNSEEAVALTEARLSFVQFEVSATFPLTIDPGSELTLPVVYNALDTDPASSTLEFRIGDFALPQPVQLRANDCEAGVPELYDADGDGVTACGGDCDDTNLATGPGEPEVYDGLDNDCDGIADEGTIGYDDDGDGYCEHPDQCTDGSLPGDCSDGDPDTNPGATETIGNDIDDDCDGIVDLGTTDLDFDGYGEGAGDCDDADPDVYPGAPELPDRVDNDCDGTVDEGTELTDDDGDGYCEGSNCSDGSTPGDCDDSAAATNPGASEIADFADNDCDGVIDEGTENADDDGDGYTEVGGDCDDTSPAINPARGNCP